MVMCHLGSSLFNTEHKLAHNIDCNIIEAEQVRDILLMVRRTNIHILYSITVEELLDWESGQCGKLFEGSLSRTGFPHL